MPPPCGSAQWIAMPTKSVWARARAAVPAGEICEARPSFHSGEPDAEDLRHVAGRVRRVDVDLAAGRVGLRQRCGEVDAGAGRAGACRRSRSSRVRGSQSPFSITRVWPAARPLTLVTLMFVSPAAARPAASDVGAGCAPEGDRGVVLEHRVRHADVADVAAGAGVRHPRRGGVADRAGPAQGGRVGVDHVVVRVRRRRLAGCSPGCRRRCCRSST